MSNRDKCMELLADVPEFKLGYVLAYLQGITADETADDMYCEQLFEEYQNDPDPEKDNATSLHDVAASLGLRS